MKISVIFFFIWENFKKEKKKRSVVKSQKHMLNTCIFKPCKAVMKDGTAEKFSF